jgi:hypothetical protein
MAEAQRQGQSYSSTTHALSVGDIVKSKINPELKGRIVWRGPARARVELLTHPTEWWKNWGERPVPMLVKNLELIRAAAQD